MTKQLPKCEHCGREYVPRSAWQKFCSNACRVAAWVKANKQLTPKK